MVNTERLETVLTAIEESEAAGGRKLDMASFRCDAREDCGTSACLAGWTALVAPGVVWTAGSIMVRDPQHWRDDSVPEFARRWLQLTDAEAEAIFYAFGVATLDELKALIGATLADPNINHGEDEPV